MGLIQIDVIRSEPLEAAFDRPFDMMCIERGATAAYRGHEPAATGASHLGGDDHRVSFAILQPLANDDFTSPRVLRLGRDRIQLRHVQEIDP